MRQSNRVKTEPFTEFSKVFERPKRPEKATGKTYIGIDNGVSGSIGVVSFTGINAEFHLTPVFNTLHYTKEIQKINRVNTDKLFQILEFFPMPFAVLERPMVNPGRFKATASALRALEATLITLERLNIPYIFVDSKEWQKVMLPKGVKGEQLKSASLEIGKRLFPQFKDKFKGDADGILIAEWARRNNL